MATSAPALARARAISRPMRRAPPLTNADLPWRGSVGIALRKSRCHATVLNGECGTPRHGLSSYEAGTDSRLVGSRRLEACLQTEAIHSTHLSRSHRTCLRRALCRNLPAALMTGMATVVVFYVLI